MSFLLKQYTYTYANQIFKISNLYFEIQKFERTQLLLHTGIVLIINMWIVVVFVFYLFSF